MVEVFEIAEIGEMELVVSIPVVLGVGGIVLCVKEPDYDGKGGKSPKVTELLDTSGLDGG